MADLHPRTLAALEAGPQLVSSWHTEISTKESPTDFARRIALIAMEEEREACAAICDEMAQHTIDPARCAKAIREQGD